MKTIAKRCIALLLAVLAALALLAGCGEEESGVIDEPPAVLEPVSNTWLDEISGKVKAASSVSVPEYDGADTITVAANTQVSYVNPFYPGSADEAAIDELVSVKLLELDRQGQTVLSGVSGETREYNGTEYFYDGIADISAVGSVCDIRLDDDVYFSDGVNLTADDVIFSMYVLADPAYDGAYDFAALPIAGMEEYRAGMEQKWRLILADLASGKTSSDYTAEERESFIQVFNDVGVEFTREIVARSVETFAEDYSGFVLNRTYTELSGSEGLQTAFAEYFCGFATGYDGSTDGAWYDASGKAYNLSDQFPTAEEFWELIKAKHGYDISDDGINYECLGDRSFEELLTEKLYSDYPQLMTAAGGGDVKTISGIEKTGMYSLRITFTQPPAELLEKLAIPVCPLHYYGSRDTYKYTESAFGFEKGNLTDIRAKAVPLGAGAYTLSALDDGGESVLERNPLYFRGCPYITYVRFVTGNSDVSETGGNVPVDSDSFVYIGINANRVSVGGNGEAEASVKLRRAFCVLFEAYRSAAAQSWGVRELTYPEAPVGALETAVETDTDAALETAVRLLMEAGYEYDADAKRFTQPPEEAAMEYTLRICGDDAAAETARGAAEALAGVGITLNIVEHTSAETLKSLAAEGGADMWIMESHGYGGDVLRRLFGTNGEESWFGIASEELDRRIDTAGSFTRMNVRSAYYHGLLGEIMEMGVIVPVYTKTDEMYFSGGVDMDTIPGDMTACRGWTEGLWQMKMN